MDLLRHGGMSLAFTGIRAPPPSGRSCGYFDHGNIRQLGSIHREILTCTAGLTDLLLGAEPAGVP
ncbi:hypothetical protein [Nocardia xishanensis]|uniref:Uncharacterized protein n=1 Tax=Nocardia xishanensis TaxID=238964 RepID=A0ABW7WW64_9NOCA